MNSDTTIFSLFLGRVIVIKVYIVISSWSTSNEGIFIYDFLVILKHSLQNWQRIMMKYFNSTTCIVMLSTCSTSVTTHWCVTRCESVKSFTFQLPGDARHEFFGGILLSYNQSLRIVDQLRHEHHSHRVKRKIRPFNLAPDFQWKMPIYFQFDGTHSKYRGGWGT